MPSVTAVLARHQASTRSPIALSPACRTSAAIACLFASSWRRNPDLMDVVSGMISVRAWGVTCYSRFVRLNEAVSDVPDEKDSPNCTGDDVRSADDVDRACGKAGCRF